MFMTIILILRNNKINDCYKIYLFYDKANNETIIKKKYCISYIIIC